MRLKVSLLATAATLLAAPAANAYEGLYGAIGAGMSYYGYENDLFNNSNGGAGPFAFRSDTEYDTGLGIYAALGYAWGNGFRTEVEYSYRAADIAAIDPSTGFSGFAPGSISGETTVQSAMANILYDFSVSSFMRPYLGGGFGYAGVDHDIIGSQSPGAPTTPVTITYGPDYGAAAYQGIAGVAFQLAENLALDVSYRFHNTFEKSFAGTLNGAPATFTTTNASHNIFAGLRWNFGASAPAPAPVRYQDCWDGSSVPVTAECPPQIVEDQFAVAEPINFTVYFDYDKSNLTPEASNLVREAASRALQNDIDTVVVAGNTDTSGSSAYNQMLSERRAAVVRDALIANGVSADRIRTEAYGETNLAKPTPDGTREPLNRRSEVTISFE